MKYFTHINGRQLEIFTPSELQNNVDPEVSRSAFVEAIVDSVITTNLSGSKFVSLTNRAVKFIKSDEEINVGGEDISPIGIYWGEGIHWRYVSAINITEMKFKEFNDIVMEIVKYLGTLHSLNITINQELEFMYNINNVSSVSVRVINFESSDIFNVPKDGRDIRGKIYDIKKLQKLLAIMLGYYNRKKLLKSANFIAKTSTDSFTRELIRIFGNKQINKHNNEVRMLAKLLKDIFVTSEMGLIDNEIYQEGYEIQEVETNINIKDYTLKDFSSIITKHNKSNKFAKYISTIIFILFGNNKTKTINTSLVDIKEFLNSLHYDLLYELFLLKHPEN